MKAASRGWLLGARCGGIATSRAAAPRARRGLASDGGLLASDGAARAARRANVTMRANLASISCLYLPCPRALSMARWSPTPAGTPSTRTACASTSSCARPRAASRGSTRRKASSRASRVKTTDGFLKDAEEYKRGSLFRGMANKGVADRRARAGALTRSLKYRYNTLQPSNRMQAQRRPRAATASCTPQGGLL